MEKLCRWKRNKLCILFWFVNNWNRRDCFLFFFFEVFVRLEETGVMCQDLSFNYLESRVAEELRGVLAQVVLVGVCSDLALDFKQEEHA